MAPTSPTHGIICQCIRVSYSTSKNHGLLLVWVHDKPERHKGLISIIPHWNGVVLVLHEICHLIHQLVLPYGLDNVRVK